jgi:interleukin receptor mimic protein A
MSFYSKSLLAFSLLILSFQANALTVQHTNTVFGNMGHCVAIIFLRSQQEIKQLDMNIIVQDATGKKLGTHNIEVEEIGASHATDSRDEFLEGEYICQDKFSLVVTRAVGIMDGQKVDLLRDKLVELADFKPMPIRLKTKSEAKSKP